MSFRQSKNLKLQKPLRINDIVDTRFYLCPLDKSLHPIRIRSEYLQNYPHPQISMDMQSSIYKSHTKKRFRPYKLLQSKYLNPWW